MAYFKLHLQLHIQRHILYSSLSNNKRILIRLVFRTNRLLIINSLCLVIKSRSCSYQVSVNPGVEIIFRRKFWPFLTIFEVNRRGTLKNGDSQIIYNRFKAVTNGCDIKTENLPHPMNDAFIISTRPYEPN